MSKRFTAAIASTGGKRAWLAIALLGLTVGPAHGQSVDDVVARHLAARGGRAAILAVESLRMEGRLRVEPGGDEVPVVIEMKRPNRMRMDMTVDGETGSQAFDGDTGWVMMPFAGMDAPETMPGDVAAEAKVQADFDGPLVDYREKGRRVELVGRERRDGREVYRVRVIFAPGHERDIFIAGDTWLEVGSESRRRLHGTTVVSETRQGDDQEVDGVTLPGFVQTGIRGVPGAQRLTIDRIHVNVPVAEARFRMPVAR